MTVNRRLFDQITKNFSYKYCQCLRENAAETLNDGSELQKNMCVDKYQERSYVMLGHAVLKDSI